MAKLADYFLQNDKAETLTLTLLEWSHYRMGDKRCISSKKPFPADARKFGEVIEEQHMTNPPTTYGYILQLFDSVVFEVVVYG